MWRHGPQGAEADDDGLLLLAHVVRRLRRGEQLEGERRRAGRAEQRAAELERKLAREAETVTTLRAELAAAEELAAKQARARKAAAQKRRRAAPAPAPAPASPDGAEQGDLFAQRSSRRVRIEAVEKEREEERRRQRRSEAKQANGRRRAEKRRAKEARAFGAEQQRQLLVDQAVVSCNPDLCRSLRGSDLSQCLWPGRALGAAFGGGDPQGGGGGGHRGAIGRRR